MSVVIHEAVGIDFTFALSAVSGESVKKSFIFIFTGENVLLINTSGDNMVDTSTAFDAGRSGHKRFSIKKDLVNLLSIPTPLQAWYG
jgi:hypothetical protein